MKSDELETLIAGLLRQHGAALRLYAATWSRFPDDCVQNALVKLALSNQVPDHLVAWLYRVIRNEAISLSRSEKRRKKRERYVAVNRDLLFQPVDCPNTGVLQAAAVAEHLQYLRPALREVLVAKIWGGLTFQDIAVAAGCSTSAAHRRYQAALVELKQKLDSSLMERANTNE